MGIKAIIESADELGDLKEFYKEDKGKFVLDVDGIDDHPRVRGVITANRENVKKRDEYKAKVAELETKLSEIPEGFSAEEYLELKANAGDPNDPNKKKIDNEHIQSQKALYETQIANLKKKHDADLKAKDEALAERDGYIDRSLVETGLKDELLNIGVQPELLDGAIASLKPSVKVKRSDNGDRKAVVETDLGEIEVPNFVKDWAASRGKAYLGKATGPDPKGNHNSRAGSKTMPRAEFDRLDPAAQMKAMTVDQIAVTD
jgi:hypothetical protein